MKMRRRFLAIMLTLCLVTGLIPAVSAAEGEHSKSEHKLCEGIVCPNEDGCGHDLISEWKPFDPDSGKIDKSGYYYMTKETTTANTIDAPGKKVIIEKDIAVTLCLNGKRLYGDEDFCINMQEGATLTVCDCGTNGMITAVGSSTGGDCRSILINGSTLNLYNGTISGNAWESSEAGGITLFGESAVFNMYGGKVMSGNGLSRSIDAGSGTVNLYGGTVDGNFCGGIYVGKDATLNISGNVIVEAYQANVKNICLYNNTITSMGKLTGSVGVTVEGGNPATDPVPFITNVSSDKDIENYFWDADDTVGKFVPVGRNTGYFGEGIKIDVSANPAEGGTVTGGGTYLKGDSVTLEAKPNLGYEFVGWKENGSEVATSETHTLTADTGRTLTAEFKKEEPPQTYTVSANASPADGGSVTGGGTYDKDSSVTVKATPKNGYKFVKWTENGSEVSKNPSYTFEATGNRTLVAVFEKEASTDDTHVHKEKNPATCTESALCATCGEFYGDPLGHVWSKWEKLDGVKHQRKCTRNGCDYMEIGDHNPTLVCGKNPTTCKVCNAHGENSHVFDKNKWQSDELGHWYGCKYCIARTDEAPHDYNKNGRKGVPQVCPTCKYGKHITEVRLGNDFKDEDIPQTLRNAGFNKVSEIQNKMEKAAKGVRAGAKDFVLYDATLVYSVDGGVSWHPATEHYFPDDGLLPVRIPVPKGTSIETHDYTVVHMFSQSSDILKTKEGKPTRAGELEIPEVYEGTDESGSEYLSFYVRGLSPILVASEKAVALNNELDDDYIPVDEDGNVPVDEEGDGRVDGSIPKDEYDKDKYIPVDDGGDGETDYVIPRDIADTDKYVPIDDNGDGKIDYVVPRDDFDKGRYVPIDKDGDGDIDYYVPKDKFDKDKYAPIDKDGDGKADHYIPNGVLTDPDGDGIYTPDGKKGPKYEGVDLDGDGIIDMYVMLAEGDGVDSGDDSNMLPWLLVMMTAITAAGVTVLGNRYRRN